MLFRLRLPILRWVLKLNTTRATTSAATPRTMPNACLYSHSRDEKRAGIAPCPLNVTRWFTYTKRTTRGSIIALSVGAFPKSVRSGSAR